MYTEVADICQRQACDKAKAAHKPRPRTSHHKHALCAKPAHRLRIASTRQSQPSQVPEFDVKQLPDLPVYEPPLTLRFIPSKSLIQGLSQLDTFQRLLTPAIIDRIIESTNSYAKNAREINPIDEDDFESFY
ncbi:hypothetical protein GJ744_005803 [Endocarpon pusillum]|uniref:Uncharacterized protein n=1 Tax=Endocarpon pusillum TaxID=364733 RepID=A0A8H7A6U3_9EURO|nr:hypothetical protein GJ744_005803 [Endocarpon pusillum]